MIQPHLLDDLRVWVTTRPSLSQPALITFTLLEVKHRSLNDNVNNDMETEQQVLLELLASVSPDMRLKSAFNNTAFVHIRGRKASMRTR